MSAALVVILVGSVLVYSAFTDTTVIELFTGQRKPVKRPAPETSDATASSGNVNTTGAAGPFKGPSAAVLNTLSKIAVDRFNLEITDICRSQARACANGNCGSKHVECRAFDAAAPMTATGKANMKAFAKWAASSEYGHLITVLHTPAGFPWPNHDDHVHIQDNS